MDVTHEVLYKDICTAKYTNYQVNIFNIASLQAGSYEVFPKSSKETSKICLVIADRVNRDIN